MPVFSLTRDELRPLAETTFAQAGLNERGDLQRLLREQIEAIAPGVLVIAEEFGDWEDSRRRIDLLGVDQDANLVVIELKRTDDGGHMELQALRYAAMVSTMTFEQAVSTFAGYLRARGDARDARETLLTHLGLEEPDENAFAQDVRIVLAAANFSRELTTAVLWLNGQGLDLRCIRMQPYADGNRLLIDVQQVIPLPEAEEYQIRIRAKEQGERVARQEKSTLDMLFAPFWTRLKEHARGRTSLHAGANPRTYYMSQSAKAAVSNLYLNYVVGRGTARVELGIFRPREESNRVFDQLFAFREEIEGLFGQPLDWQRLDEKNVCRICREFPANVRNESEWPALIESLVDAMVRLESALRPHLDRLTLK